MLRTRGLLSARSRQPGSCLASNLLACPTLQQSPYRPYTSSSHDSHPRPSRRRLVVSSVLGAGAAAVGLSLYQRAKTSETEISKGDQDRPLANVSFATLLRSYVVYTCCSISLLVDAGPSVVDWCNETSIPGVWTCFEYLVRHTFFKQFVGGETAEECLELTREMSKNSLGAMLNYSAEVHDKKDHSSSDKEDDPNRKLCIDKVKAIIHLIETSGRFIEAEELTGNAVDRNRDSLMVAVKLSGLIKDASVLERASARLVPRELFSRPPTTTPPSDSSSRGAHASLNIPTASLSKHDVESIKQLWTALQAIATSAKRNGNIRILIDAEHSWYQPAIDALFESCAQQFNAIPASISSWRSLFSTGRESRGLDPDRFHGPLVYNTLQAYLRRTPSYLAMSLERAKQGGYALGVKLVRGAYVEQENKEWSTKIVPTPPSHNDGSSDHLASPVWPNKDLTDQCYNECADLLIREVAKDLHNQSNSKASFARLGLVLAGHNWISNMTAVQTMIDTGLAVDQDKASGLGSTSPPYRNLVLSPSVRGRIHFAQLYGMADDLTRALQQSFDNESGGPGPHLVLKYIPYGDLRLVMPYLIRRAKENKSVMGAGGAQKERSVLAAEMRRRLWP